MALEVGWWGWGWVGTGGGFEYIKHGGCGGGGAVGDSRTGLSGGTCTGGRASAGARGAHLGRPQEGGVHKGRFCWQVAWVVVRPLYLKMGGTLAQGHPWYSSGGYGVARERVGGVNSGAGRAPVAMGRDGMPTLVVQTWGARKQAAYSASDP